MYLALKLIKDSLDRFLVNHFSLEENIVQINRVVDKDGNRPADNGNKITLCLINLCRETNSQYFNRSSSDSNGLVVKNRPPPHFNMEILCVSDFDAYDESLRFLSGTLHFFQKNPSLSLAKTSEDISFNEQNILRLDIESESYLNTHNLWSSIGAKYQPSVIIKAHHITIDGNAVVRRAPQIKGVDVNVNG
jgi:hypothetical protein